MSKHTSIKKKNDYKVVVRYSEPSMEGREALAEARRYVFFKLVKRILQQKKNEKISV